MKQMGDVWELFGETSPRLAKENVLITEYERIPAVVLNSVVKKSRGTMTLYMDISALDLCYKGKFISVQFLINAPTLDESQRLFEKYQPLRDAVFNTLYLPQSYQ